MSQLTTQTDLKTDAFSIPRSPMNSNRINSGTDRKKLLGISAATLLLGGSAWAISRKITEHNPKTPEQVLTTESTSTSASLPADIDVAGKTTDDMSFEQAFKAAREEVGMGGVFSWHGHWYNTFDKEEWDGLSLDQRQEFTEMVTGEKLPIKPYHAHATDQTSVASTHSTEPTIIEGYLNGQRVMGLDFDQDGVIDTLVMDAVDGYTYRIVDAGGNQGLDTILRYDSLDGELMEIEKIEHPFVLSNDQFSQGLEASMSKEVVDSILDDDVPATHSVMPVDDGDEMDASEPNADDSTSEHPTYLANAYEADDDTYINNGDVHDMDE